MEKQYRYEQEEAIVRRQDIHLFPQDIPQGRGFSTHIHTAVEILHFREGRMRVISEEEEFIAGPGCTVLIRSDTVHTGISLDEEGCRYWVLKIKPEYLYDVSFRDRSSRYLLDFTLNRTGKKILWPKEESEASGITAAFEEMMKEQQDRNYGYDIAVKTCASRILLTLLRGMQTQAPPSDDREQTVRNVYDTMLYLSEHYKEDVTAEDCAARCYLSYSYFSRAFRKITGKPFRTYLTQLRIDHARRELVATKHPITRVAADCGFANVAYFISVFRKQTGLTPLTYRREYGKKQ